MKLFIATIVWSDVMTASQPTRHGYILVASISKLSHNNLDLPRTTCTSGTFACPYPPHGLLMQCANVQPKVDLALTQATPLCWRKISVQLENYYRMLSSLD